MPFPQGSLVRIRHFLPLQAFGLILFFIFFMFLFFAMLEVDGLQGL